MLVLPLLAGESSMDMRSRLEIEAKIDEYIEKMDPYWDDLRAYIKGSPYYERAQNSVTHLQGIVQALKWTLGIEAL